MKCSECGSDNCCCAYKRELEKLKKERDKLALACQLFTGSFEKGGYLPALGSITCQKILNLMEEANVRPIHYWEWHRLIRESITEEIK